MAQCTTSHSRPPRSSPARSATCCNASCARPESRRARGFHHRIRHDGQDETDLQSRRDDGSEVYQPRNDLLAILLGAGVMNSDDAKTGEGLQSMVFSSFRLDRRTGQLTRDGTPIPLRAKTWALLLYLVERPGVLVTRDELLDALWPGVAVTPDTLTKSISELRRALGDEPATPRYIETVHRRGVRFKGSGVGCEGPGVRCWGPNVRFNGGPGT